MQPTRPHASRLLIEGLPGHESGFVSGHDFSRAEHSPKKDGALAPAAERVVRSTTTVEAPGFSPGNHALPLAGLQARES
ncbi:MAG: hypothetical protein WCC14_09345, partial [Acidobacteriaceae bacterium]